MTYIIVGIRNAFQDVVDRRFENHTFHARRLRATDGPFSVGMRVANWTHDQRSAQIAQVEPGVGSYTLQVQNMVVHMDEEQGRAIFDRQCALVRTVLYRDEPLRVGLLGIEEVLDGYVERTKRLTIVRQDFLDAEVSKRMTYLCSTEVRIETEITRQ
jgi:hypothetical protein